VSTTTAAGQQHGIPGSGPISHEGSLKVKSTKQSNRWSGLFSNSIKVCQIGLSLCVIQLCFVCIGAAIIIRV